MSYSVADAADIESVREGRLKRVRQALGVTAFGINQIQLPPGGSGSDHDEAESGQEEVYLVLAGDGVMAVDGELVELIPERFVFVAPGTQRQVRAGAAGITFVCVGSPPGRPYEPRS